jgi:lysophospholipase L1-like esterase
MDKSKFAGIIWLKVAGIVIIIVAIVYCNRAYAYIYNHIDKVNLAAPDQNNTYLVVNNKTASSSLTYVALGDSLSAGVGVDNYNESFPYLLAQYLAGNNYRLTLKDRAVPGARTQDLMNSLLPATINDNPDVVTLLIGVNDIHGWISKDEFRKNYDFILSRLTKETKAKIYIVNIPYIGADNLILPPYNTIFDYQTKQYNEIISELAAKYSVKYIDLYTMTSDLFKRSGPHYAADFFHPSAEGYKIWADLIYADISN